MRPAFAYSIACLFVIALFAGIAPAVADPEPGPAPESTPDPKERVRLIVGYDDALPALFANVLAEHGATLLRTDERLDFAVVEAPADLQSRLLGILSHTEGITYAKEDGQIEAHHTPNDPRYSQQWGPPTIGMEAAWDQGLGNHTIEVAVIDTGVDYDHPDLDDNICRLGPDYVNDDADPYDDHYHGTHVAGTVAGEIDNEQGVAGMGNVCVVPIKVLNAWGSGQWSDLASALTWAADNGIEIISMSLGGCCDPGEPVTSAMQYAAEQGVLIVASAGNSYCGSVGYPAAYPEAIAVAATREPGDEVASFSSCGPEVEISAPGQDVLSTMPGDSYDSLSGTSMAAPHVSGAAALFWSQYPMLSADVVRCIMAQNTDDLLEAGHDEQSGYGRMNVPAMFANPECLVKVPVEPVLEALPGDGMIHLGWSKPFAWGGVDGYEILRGTSPDHLAPYATVEEPDRTFTDADVTLGTTYHYAVAAYNEAGTGESSPTLSVMAQAAVEAPVTFDFEDGADGWTTTGLWHRTDARADSGDHSMYFGVERGGTIPILDPAYRDYRTGQAEYGALISPPLQVPHNVSSITFWEYLHLEGAPAEHGLIEISRESDPFNFTTLWEKGWQHRHIGDAAADLSGYAGEVVHLRFVVDTGDPYANHYEGWFVDAIRFEAAAAPAYAPTVIVEYPSGYGYQGATVYVEGILSDANGDGDVTTIDIGIAGLDSTHLFREGHRFHAVIRDVPTGTHELKVTIRDSTGLEHTSTRTLRVDADPPTLELHSPDVGSIHDCIITLHGTAYDTGGAGLGYAYGYAVSASDLSSKYHQGWWEFDGGDTERFWLNVTLPASHEGPVDVHVITYDRAWNHNVTTYSFEKSAVDCKPQITWTAPLDGSTVSGVVEIDGTVDFYGNNSGRVYVLVDDKVVDRFDMVGGGGFTHDWDTFDVPDGNHTISVVALDDRFNGYNWTARTVDVLNPRDPHVVNETFEGSVGCSVGLGLIRTRDSCEGTSVQTTQVLPGLTAGRLFLTWDSDLPAGVDSLSVSLQIGVQSWEATAAPGDRQLVLEVGDGEVLAKDLTNVKIEVRAAFDTTTPSVAFEEDYELDAVWAYWDAPLL